MESNPVTPAKSTTGDSSSPSPVEIFDGNSSPLKIENTPVTTTVEANNGDSLSPVEMARRVRVRKSMKKQKMENKPITVVEVSDVSSVKVANKDCPEIREEKMESRRVIAAKAARDYSQGKMESLLIPTPKMEKTPVDAAEATNGNFSWPWVDSDCVVEELSLKLPSFERPSGGSTRDTMEFSVSGNIVIIRPRASGSENKTKEEDDEEIAEELAVCKFCFNKFAEENVRKTKCNCKTGLVHDNCASHQFTELGNNMCEVCDQEVEIIPVTLLQRPFSPKKKKRESKIESFLRLKRYFLCS